MAAKVIVFGNFKARVGWTSDIWEVIPDEGKWDDSKHLKRTVVEQTFKKICNSN